MKENNKIEGPKVQSKMEFKVNWGDGGADDIISPDYYKKFLVDVEKAINNNCIENYSNTPDFILAKFLQSQLEAVEELLKNRDKWYGIKPCPAWEGWDGEKVNTIIERLKNMKKIQGDSLTNHYMYGLYNGLELAYSLMLDKKPELKRVPDNINNSSKGAD